LLLLLLLLPPTMLTTCAEMKLPATTAATASKATTATKESIKHFKWIPMKLEATSWPAWAPRAPWSPLLQSFFTKLIIQLTPLWI